jgi:hypothetical protein
MATTFVKIQTVSVGVSGSASIDFTSIPQTYTDLKIVVSAKNNRADTLDHLLIGFNGSTTSFTNRQLTGTSTTASSSTSVPRSVGVMNSASSTASVFNNGDIYVFDYTSAANKRYSADSVSEVNSVGDNFLCLTAGLWSNTAAITSISLTNNVGTSFVQYTTATLYGIKSS